MKITKNEKGITLVALIITIVVLLILAGVTIVTLNNTNIIGYANNAVTVHNGEEQKENQLLNESENLLQQQNCKHESANVECDRWDYNSGTSTHEVRVFCPTCGLSYSYWEDCVGTWWEHCEKCGWQIS